jgi:trigger factor
MAEVEGEKLFEQEEIEYRLTDDSLASLPGLADQIVGLEKGADVKIEHQVPEDFDNERLKGKTVSYHVVVADVKEEILAAEDDAFAKEVGEGFDSIKDLRDRIRDDLQKAQEEAALNLYESQVLDKLVEGATIEYPAVLIDREIDRILDEQANLDPRDPRAQQLYLLRLGKTEEEVRDEVRETAEQRLRRSLVLSQFAEAENIEVSEEEIDEDLQKMAESAGEQADAILRLFGSENGRDTLRRSKLTRKTFERLVEIAGADGGAVATETAKEPARRPAKGRRTGPREADLPIRHT